MVLARWEVTGDPLSRTLNISATARGRSRDCTATASAVVLDRRRRRKWTIGPRRISGPSVARRRVASIGGRNRTTACRYRRLAGLLERRAGPSRLETLFGGNSGVSTRAWALGPRSRFSVRPCHGQRPRFRLEMKLSRVRMKTGRRARDLAQRSSRRTMMSAATRNSRGAGSSGQGRSERDCASRHLRVTGDRNREGPPARRR